MEYLRWTKGKIWGIEICISAARSMKCSIGFKLPAAFNTFEPLNIRSFSEGYLNLTLLSVMFLLSHMELMY